MPNKHPTPERLKATATLGLELLVHRQQLPLRLRLLVRQQVLAWLAVGIELGESSYDREPPFAARGESPSNRTS